MLIKGITVRLHEKKQAGIDGFNQPIYTETAVDVENVLVSPVGASEIVDNTELDGGKAEYVLCIPKGDRHDWKGARIEFFGKMWRAFGAEEEYIEDNLPLCWNKKIKVMHYE